MKNFIWAAVLAAGLTVPAAAQQAGQLGVGVLLGDPTSASVKYFMTDTSALDFGLGVSQNLVLHADYVYHIFDFKPQPSKGKLGFYGAVGPRLEFEDHTDFGIRLIPGVSYWPAFKKHTVEFFVELGPVIRLTQGVRTTIDGGFGLRCYFSRK
jgi:hypothetical protein